MNDGPDHRRLPPLREPSGRSPHSRRVKIWLDALLPPSLARWMSTDLGVDATALRELGLRDARDEEIFMAARAADAVVLTKDADFVALLERLGPPPRVLWVTCGNTTNARR